MTDGKPLVDGHTHSLESSFIRRETDVKVTFLEQTEVKFPDSMRRFQVG